MNHDEIFILTFDTNSTTTIEGKSFLNINLSEFKIKFSKQYDEHDKEEEEEEDNEHLRFF